VSAGEHLVVPLADLPEVTVDANGWLIAGDLAVCTDDADPAQAWATALSYVAAALHLALPPPTAAPDVLDDVAVVVGAAPATPADLDRARSRVRQALADGRLHTTDPTS